MEELLMSFGLPVWWAVSFAAAAALLRRIRHSADPGKRLLLAIIVLAIFAMLSIMPYMVLALVIPLLIVFMFVPKWWFRIGVFAVSLFMAVGLYLAFASFNRDRREAKALIAAMIDDPSGAWRESFARIAAEWATASAKTPAEPAPERPVTENPLLGGRGPGDMFVSDANDAKIQFAAQKIESVAGLDLTVPIPDGYSSGIGSDNFRLETGRASDFSLTTLVFRASSDMIIAVFADFSKPGLEEPALETVRAAYAEASAMERDMAVPIRLFEDDGYAATYIAPPEVAQNSAGMIAGHASVILVPDESRRAGGEFGVEVDLLCGAVELAGTSRRFWIVSMCDNMEEGLKTAVTWLNRLEAENAAEDARNADVLGGSS